jgi:hypothetical protein
MRRTAVLLGGAVTLAACGDGSTGERPPDATPSPSGVACTPSCERKINCAGTWSDPVPLAVPYEGDQAVCRIDTGFVITPEPGPVILRVTRERDDVPLGVLVHVPEDPLERVDEWRIGRDTEMVFVAEGGEYEVDIFTGGVEAYYHLAITGGCRGDGDCPGRYRTCAASGRSCDDACPADGHPRSLAAAAAAPPVTLGEEMAGTLCGIKDVHWYRVQTTLPREPVVVKVRGTQYEAVVRVASASGDFLSWFLPPTPGDYFVRLSHHYVPQEHFTIRINKGCTGLTCANGSECNPDGTCG